MRAHYRWTHTHTNLFDLSYSCWLELRGDSSSVLHCINALLRKQWIEVPSAGHAHDRLLYRPGEGEGGAEATLLGPANLVWVPQGEGDTQLWMCVHPSIHDGVFAALSAACAASSVSRDAYHAHANTLAGYPGRRPRVLASPTAPPPALTPPAQVELMDRKNDLLRFRLSGPTAHPILRSVLRPVQREEAGDDPAAAGEATWERLEHLTSTAALFPGTIVGLTVSDPRLQTPRSNKPKKAEAPSVPSRAAQRALTEVGVGSPAGTQPVLLSIRPSLTVPARPDCRACCLPATDHRQLARRCRRIRTVERGAPVCYCREHVPAEGHQRPTEQASHPWGRFGADR